MKQKIILFKYLILFAGVWACGVEEASKDEDKRPNIILIMADDMGFSDIGYFGSEIPTPNLDRLAENGLVMTQFYNSSVCVPTRASLLTGLYQHQVGLGNMTRDMGDPSYQGYLNKEGVTIAEALKNGGYHTMMTGKWHLGSVKKAWPQQRGFDQVFGVPKGGGIYFYPFLIDRTVMLNDQVYQPDSSFYSTNAFTDYSIKFLDDVKNSADPFFLYTAYISPHYPLQAPDSVIARHRGKYKEGFETVRKKRFEKLKKQGIIAEDLKLSPPDKYVEAWEDLSPAQKDTFDLRMAVYASQIEIMDQGIGRIIQKLKAMGEYENTVVMFLSDNGAQGPPHPGPLENSSGPIGSRTYWGSYTSSWANVSNTPFRLYKLFEQEGGIATPLIMHWPARIQNHRKEKSQVGHVIDIMPTILDIAGVGYPERYEGSEILPLEGKSLLPVIKGDKLKEKRTLFWEHKGNRAVRQGDWKLVSIFPENQWRLFNMADDRTEQNNMADEKPELVNELIEKYENWADRVGVIPWGKLKEQN